MRKSIFTKPALYSVKLVVAFLIVFLVFRKIDIGKAFSGIVNIDFLTLLLIFVIACLNLFSQYHKWRYLIKSNTNDYNPDDLLPSFFSGFAFRMLIPGGHIEGTKIFLLPGRKRGKAIAFVTEKFFQTYIKVCLVALVIPLSFPKYRWASMVVLAALVLIYIALPLVKKLGRLQEIEVANRKVFTVTLIFSFLVYLFLSMQFFFMLNHGNSISFIQTAHNVAYLYGVTVIPISMSGLGLREGLAMFFFEKQGVTPEHAVAVSLFLFLLNNMIPAIIGLYFIYIKRMHLLDVKQSMKSMIEILKSIRKRDN